MTIARLMKLRSIRLLNGGDAGAARCADDGDVRVAQRCLLEAFEFDQRLPVSQHRRQFVVLRRREVALRLSDRLLAMLQESRSAKSPDRSDR